MSADDESDRDNNFMLIIRTMLRVKKSHSHSKTPSVQESLKFNQMETNRKMMKRKTFFFCHRMFNDPKRERLTIFSSSRLFNFSRLFCFDLAPFRAWGGGTPHNCVTENILCLSTLDYKITAFAQIIVASYPTRFSRLLPRSAMCLCFLISLVPCC